MRHKIILALGVVLFTTLSCSKEEVAHFNDYDRNWLTVVDDPKDAATHSAYLFYKETGIPVFFNDTIGSQERVDMFGHTYTYYETLSLNYSLGGPQTSVAKPYVRSFSYCSKDDVSGAIDFLKTEIVARIPKGIYIPSIFLVENLDAFAFGNYAYKGLNTIVIGKISAIAQMTDSEKAKYKGAIFRSIVLSKVIGGDYDEILQKFYAVSRKLSPNKDIYNLYKGQLAQYVTGLPSGSTTEMMNYCGFLRTDPRTDLNWGYTPEETWMDVCMYIEAVLGYSKEEFNALYGSHERIMTKYDYIKEIVTHLGL